MSRTETEQAAFDQELRELIVLLKGSEADVILSRCHDFQKAYPDDCEGYFLLGLYSYFVKRSGDAFRMFELAHEKNPDCREAALAMASLHAQAGRLRDALYFSKLGLVLDEHDQLSALMPQELLNFVEATERPALHYHYINAMYAFHTHDFDETVRQCELDLSIESHYEPAEVLLAKACMGQKNHHRAAQVLEGVYEHNPDCDADVLVLLGEALMRLGLFDNAKVFVAEAMKRAPDELDIAVHALNVLAYMPKAQDEIEAILSTLQQGVLSEKEPYFDNPTFDQQMVRIGIISDQFYDCVGGRTVNQLLSFIDKSQFITYCYTQNTKRDSVSVSIGNNAEVMRDVYDVDDKTLSLILQGDGIDVLIDMCGFSPQHRLELMAHCPGRVRLNWMASPFNLVSPGSTDVFAQDGFLTNTPDGIQAQVLEGSLFTITKKEGEAEVTALPALAKGHITFGTHMDLVALAQGDGELLVNVLKTVENAQLKINVGEAFSEFSLASLNAVFEEHGLQDRVSLYAPDEDTRVADFYQDIDIYIPLLFSDANDVYTALNMGVPAIGRWVKNSPSPYGHMVVAKGGFESWMANNADGVVSIAQDLASNIDRLSSLRQDLRSTLQGSSLMDAKTMVLSLLTTILNLYFRSKKNAEA